MTLDDTSTGVWLVETMTSAYQLDMDARTVIRRPKVNVGGEWIVAPLRKDEEVVELEKLIHPARLNLPLDMFIWVREGYRTWRQSTPVQKIWSPGTWS